MCDVEGVWDQTISQNDSHTVGVSDATCLDSKFVLINSESVAWLRFGRGRARIGEGRDREFKGACDTVSELEDAHSSRVYLTID